MKKKIFVTRRLLKENEEKLKERFPLWDTGGYDKDSNENRKEGDI